MKRFLYYWTPVAAWCGVIFYLSGIPSLATEWGIWDFVFRKIAHVAEYAVLFVLSRRALVGTVAGPRGRLVSLAAVFSVLYAVSDEYHQSFVPGRGPSAVDVGVDTLGVLIALFVSRYAEAGPGKKGLKDCP